MTGLRVLGLAALAAAGPPVGSRVAPAALQDRPARYRAEMLACARFTETVATRVRGQSGGATVATRTGREGLLVITAADSAAGLRVEAWYDSLAVWQEDGAVRVAAPTDGFVGGRYRGALSAAGRYRPERDPFVPADLAQVADLARTLDDFFPRLPPVRLEVGREWRDSLGTIRRLGNRRFGSGTVERYQWTASGRESERYEASDSLAATLDQVIEERGELLWSPEYGPLSWSRRFTITARIPPTGGVRRPIRSVVEQEVEVVRRPELDQPCHP